MPYKGSVNAAPSSLYTALGLKVRSEPSQTRIYSDIKSTIRRVIKDLLDPVLPYTEQKAENIVEVQSRISQAFPDLFEDPAISNAVRQKRIAGAENYGRKFFSSLRHNHKKNREPKFEDQDQAVATEPLFPGTKLDNAPSNQQDQTTGTNTTAHGSRPFASADFTSSASTLVPGPTPSISSAGGISSLPNPSINTTTSFLSSSTQGHSSHPAPECRIDEVAAFLGSCAPDMRFLLGSFVEFGCLNHQFLAGVSKWSPSEIDEFLRGLVVPVSEVHLQGKLTPMDILVLRRHLRRYTWDIDATNKMEVEIL